MNPPVCDNVAYSCCICNCIWLGIGPVACIIRFMYIICEVCAVAELATFSCWRSACSGSWTVVIGVTPEAPTTGSVTWDPIVVVIPKAATGEMTPCIMRLRFRAVSITFCISLRLLSNSLIRLSLMRPPSINMARRASSSVKKAMKASP